VQAQFTETYTFTTTSDDGIRLWVNGQLLVDDWVPQPPTAKSGSIALVAGQKYPIEIDYYQAGGGDVADLAWSSPSTPNTLVPQSQLYSTSVSPVDAGSHEAGGGGPDAAVADGADGGGGGTGGGHGLLGTYYPALNFGGSPVTEIDPTIDFNWNGAAPAPGVPGTDFSVRWTGQVQAQFSETYTFTTTADDGIRLWVNGTLIIDNWVDQAPTTKSGTITLVMGQFYPIKVEYYQAMGGDEAILGWSSPSTPQQVVPQSQLTNP
jgi:hypothetical protein